MQKKLVILLIIATLFTGIVGYKVFFTPVDLDVQLGRQLIKSAEEEPEQWSLVTAQNKEDNSMHNYLLNSNKKLVVELLDNPWGINRTLEITSVGSTSVKIVHWNGYLALECLQCNLNKQREQQIDSIEDFEKSFLLTKF